MDIKKCPINKYKMRFHPGHIESCHNKIDNSWYLENHYDHKFCSNLENGYFIACGNTSNNLYGSYENKLCLTNKYLSDDKTTCCFVYGKLCWDEKLRRKWTCCNNQTEGTIFDLINIVGCEDSQINDEKEKLNKFLLN